MCRFETLLSAAALRSPDWLSSAATTVFRSLCWLKLTSCLGPTDYDISKSIADAYEAYHRLNWQESMGPNIDELKRAVANLEKRGCRVVLFEIPSPPGIRETPYSVAVRTADTRSISRSNEVDHNFRSGGRSPTPSALRTKAFGSSPNCSPRSSIG
jgi:hypothetical protein